MRVYGKFICVFGLTREIQQIYLNFCFDVQCLKSQIFSSSCAKNRYDFFAKVLVEGEVDGNNCCVFHKDNLQIFG